MYFKYFILLLKSSPKKNSASNHNDVDMNQNDTIQENELDSLSDHVPNLPYKLDFLGEQGDRVATTRITMDESSTETSTLVAEIMVSVCFFLFIDVYFP